MALDPATARDLAAMFTRGNPGAGDDFEPAGRCAYAFPGTYGHECGKPAKWAGDSPSTTGTTTGRYWHLRCYECKGLTGPDNRGIESWEPFDPARHVNRWK